MKQVQRVLLFTRRKNKVGKVPAEDEELTCVFCQRNQTEGVVYKYFPESRLSPLCLLNHHDNIDRNDNTEGKRLKKKGKLLLHAQTPVKKINKLPELQWISSHRILMSAPRRGGEEKARGDIFKHQSTSEEL